MTTPHSDVPRIVVDNTSIHVDDSDKRDGTSCNETSSLLVPDLPPPILSAGSSVHSGQPVDPETPSLSRPYSDLGHPNPSCASRTSLISNAVHQLNQDSKSYPFPYDQSRLASLVDSSRVDEEMRRLGGTQALLSGLGTDGERGLSRNALDVDSGVVAYEGVDGQRNRIWRWIKDAGKGASTQHETQEGQYRNIEQSADVLSASVDERRRVYGPNILPTKPSKHLFSLIWLALKDKVLILLSIVAVISLALRLFQDFGALRPKGQPPIDWVGDVAIMVAVVIVVIVGSLNDWQRERQFKRLNDKKEERGVKVIRDGVEHVINSKEVVVGDVALLEPGEIVPCDGIFLSGHHVRCDETDFTGKSDVNRKLTYEDCMGYDTRDGQTPNCLVVSGSKVLEGVGRYVVIAVGTNSFHGRIKTALQSDPETTPLQLKLNSLAELIAKLGLIAGFLLFGALMIRFFVQLGENKPVRSAGQKGMAFLNILITSITLVVVAIPEGLPLAVMLALAFATKQMTAENLLVRVRGACETMANVSVICTDETGTLTQNVMTVVAGAIGVYGKFVMDLQQNQGQHNDSQAENSDDFLIDQALLNNVLPPALRNLFNEAIAVNSTAFEDSNTENQEMIFVGNQTEIALLQFTRNMGWNGYQETRDAADVVQIIPFSSQHMAIAVIIRLPDNAGYRAYVKGSPEFLSMKCTSYVVIHSPKLSPKARGADGVETKKIGLSEEEKISQTIIFYAEQPLRTIALCYKDFAEWPPAGLNLNDENELAFEDLAKDLTLLAIIAIKNPLRIGVPDAVSKCNDAGVKVMVCTGDNVKTACAIAKQCGIPSDSVMEGLQLRRLSEEEQNITVPGLRVLARSSPKDKEVLVRTLRRLGEIVAVTGDGVNVGPALKVANVGFSMGITGTEVAKEASDIILMDDNFVSVVKAIIWGRCINDAVRKFLQFQITTNIAAVVVTFVSAVASTEETSILSPIQLLWINIIMDTFAALALATDPASESLLKRRPVKEMTSLFTTDMYKQILIQSIYQITIILIFHFFGLRILGLELNGNPQVDKHVNLIVQTLVFNTFVFAQIFNSLNCRQLDRGLNVFKGILRNPYFLVITLIEIGVQTLIVFAAEDVFQVTRIGGLEWGCSLAVGVGSIVLGAFTRRLPNEPFERAFRQLGLLGSLEVLPMTSHESDTQSHAKNIARKNLTTFKTVRGGRLRSSSSVYKGKTVARHTDSGFELPQTS